MYGGCKNADDSSPWAIENYRNIYVFDSMDGFTFGRSFDRYTDWDFQNDEMSKYLMTQSKLTSFFEGTMALLPIFTTTSTGRTRATRIKMRRHFPGI